MERHLRTVLNVMTISICHWVWWTRKNSQRWETFQLFQSWWRISIFHWVWWSMKELTVRNHSIVPSVINIFSCQLVLSSMKKLTKVGNHLIVPYVSKMSIWQLVWRSMKKLTIKYHYIVPYVMKTSSSSCQLVWTSMNELTMVRNHLIVPYVTISIY